MVFRRILAFLLMLSMILSASALADTESGLMLLKLDEIEAEAFCGDSALREVELPSATRVIGSRAFAECKNLTAFYCYSKDVRIAEDAFENTENVCIYCYTGSSMDAYAQRKGMKTLYFDKFSIACNTVSNGVMGLPVTWTVTDTLPESKVQSTYIYKVYENGALVQTSEETGSTKYVYTPTASGTVRVDVTMKNALGEVTVKSENVSVSDKLYLGTFEQDGNESTQDAVEWIIIHAEEDKAFVLSKYILKTDSFFNPAWIKYKYCNWAGSIITTYRSSNNWYPSASSMSFKKINGVTMVPKKDGTYISNDDLTRLYHCRTWCNDTFYGGAFTEDEKARILLTKNTNPENPSYSSIDGGPDTYDYVFFLSYEELTKYMPDVSSRKAKNTAVAQKQLGDKTVYWWLRTRGGYTVNAACVYASSGKVWMSGSDVGHDCVGYRPAMWITVGG